MSKTIHYLNGTLAEISRLPETFVYKRILNNIENGMNDGSISDSNADRLYLQLITDYLKDRKAVSKTLSEYERIVVLDALMGTGKSTYLINMINNNPDMKFVCIVPTLDEIQRYRDEIDRPTFEPLPTYKETGKDGEEKEVTVTKTEGLKRLIRNGVNIVCTHALISLIDEETMQLLKAAHYTLIIDECLDCVDSYGSDYKFKKSDLKHLLKSGLASIDEQGFLKWNNAEQDFDGRYEDVKNLCNLNSLMVLKNSEEVLVWVFPVSFFGLFDKCYIATYLFNGNLQSSYFKLNRIKYLHMTLKRTDSLPVDDRFIVEPYNPKAELEQRKQLISLMDVHSSFRGDDFIFSQKSGKGRKSEPLCHNWCKKAKHTSDGKAKLGKLKKNLYNFFRNTVHAKADDIMWTTFKDIRSCLEGKGYSDSFVPCNSKGTNEYRHKWALAYMINLFPSTDIINFFSSYDIEVNQRLYALSELLQWIWRSRIREGKKIVLYMPSPRMRNILADWFLGEL